MNITYQSTRGGERGLTASQAILKGLAVDGGLFMPDQIPQLDVSMGQLAKMSYQEIAYEVMKLFLTDFTEEELHLVTVLFSMTSGSAMAVTVLLL